MNGDMAKIMQSLDLDYSKAILSTKHFEQQISSLNKQLMGMKGIALQAAKDVNNTFSAQLGSGIGSKSILDQYGNPLKTIQTQMTNIGSTATKGYGSATSAAKQHGQSVEDVAKQYNVLESQFSRRAGWFISGSIFYGALKGAKEAITTIKEVEMGMVEIARVMEDTTFVFKDYRDELLKLGVDYGQSFDTVQQIALRWAQSGYNVADSLELAKTSLLALNTAELDAKNATESMIGIMAQWELQAEDLALVMDKINLTADNYSITSQDLVDGLLRSSGAARNMNMTLDETISLLTVMREASGRTGREVGNALNSIISYIQRPTAINTMESLGISMFVDEAETQFRNAMDIFKDIATQWELSSETIKDGFVESADEAGLFNEELAMSLGLQEEWNDLQKRDVAQSSAGVHRRNYFIGMINRMSNAQEVLNGLTDAAGYSLAENERTMDTLEKKYQSLKTSAEQLAVTLGDAGLLDALKGIVDLGIDVTQGFANMDEGARTLLITSLEIIAAVAALKGLKGMFTGKNLFFGTAEAAALLPGWTKLLAIIPLVIGAVSLYSHNLEGATDATNGLRERQDQLTESYNNGLKSAGETEKSMLEQAATAETLAKKLEELNSKEQLNKSEKAQLKDITDRLNSSFSNLGLEVDNNTGKVIGNTTAIYDNINALKQQAIAQGYQARMQATASAYVEQELLLGKSKSELDIAKGNISSLTADEANALKQAEAEIAKIKERGLANRPETNAIRGVYKKYGITDARFGINENYVKVNELQGLISEQEQELAKLDAELDDWVNKTVEATSNIDGNEYVPTTPADSGGSGTSTSSVAYSNKALDNALKALDYKKHLNELTLEDEIAMLNDIKLNHVNTADELMNINKRIYDAETTLMDKRKRASEETYRLEENNIQHLTKLGVYNVEEQIEAYKRLYRVKAESIDEEQKRVENLFSLYNQLLSKQQGEIKDAYDERISLIDKEADRKKQSLEEEKEALQDQLDLLNRRDAQRSHNQEMKKLQDELAYWQVRTSEEARKKVVEIEKQIDEEKYKNDLEEKKQSIDDKIDAIDDEVKEVERLANKEKDRWATSYKLTEKAFNEHSSSIIAMAATMSKQAYQQWEQNYLIPLKNALISGDFDSFDTIGGQLEGSIGDLDSNVANSNNAAIYRAANSILNLKKQWTDGSSTAADTAKQYYNTLRNLGGMGANVADQLSVADLETAKSIVAGLPKFHGGGKAYSDGIAVLKKDEWTFPPEFSTGLERLFPLLVNLGKGNGTSNDNRKDISIGTLLNIERNYMDDDVDGEILARQIGRQVLNIQ